MSDPFVAEVRIVGFSFAPKGWATCDGQLLSISQNTALFSLLGTMYGGDGKSTFGLPNIDGSVVMGQGAGTGLSERYIGETGGAAAELLQQAQMPQHTHNMQGANTTGDTPVPDVHSLARYPGQYQDDTSQNLANMALQSLPPQGGGLPHNNMQPYQVLLYVVAMQGVFPPRG
jgi:microcystin-dependent protein